MADQAKHKGIEKINVLRIVFAIGYFIVPICLVWVFSDKIFYLTEKEGIESLYRFLWCVLSSMCGFALIAFHWRAESKSPWPEYITFYPFMLIVISSFVFSILHLFEKTSGYLFYYYSFTFCALLGCRVDYVWNMIDKIEEAIIKKVGANITS